MPRLSAAYGLFYLDNRPILLRALEVGHAPSPAVLEAAKAHGFNAIRVAERGADFAVEADRHGLAVVDSAIAGEPAAGDLHARPFGLSLQAERLASSADQAHPPAVWGAPASLPVLASALARGIKAYSLVSDAVLDAPIRRLHEWLAAHEEELTASAPARDPLALLAYEPSSQADLLEGGFGVLASAGYAPSVLDLGAATDADLADFPAAVFPSQGVLDLDDYGKLVVLTLRGATLVTYPEPVRRMADGTPFRTAFLWPQPSSSARSATGGERQIGHRAQVRDGVSTLLYEPLGEPYAGPAYYRLPAAQRRAYRDLVLSLLEDASTRQIAPDPDLEMEVVARLSPEGGALLFVINRLAEQSGHIRFPFPEALNCKPSLTAQILFSGAGSTAATDGDGVHVKMAAQDAVILRLG